MRRISIAILLVFVFLPLAAFAVQSAPDLLSGNGGGLVPGTASNNAGGAYYKACDIVELVQNVITFAIAFSVIVATLMFAWAGVLYVTAASNPEQVKKAHKVFGNIFVGLLLVLLAWLIVNILFSVLTGQGLEKWGHVSCIANPTSDPFAAAPRTGAVQGGASPRSVLTSNGGGGGGAGTPSQAARGLCTPTALVANGMNPTLASRMSCVTTFEDGPCILNQPSRSDVGADGNSVSFGMFQINISSHDLNQYPACKAAVNNAPLNCPAAFQGGAYTRTNHSTRVSNSALYHTCISAVSNPRCNIAAAQDTYNQRQQQRRDPLGAWGEDAQRGCSQ